MVQFIYTDDPEEGAGHRGDEIHPKLQKEKKGVDEIAQWMMAL